MSAEIIPIRAGFRDLSSGSSTVTSLVAQVEVRSADAVRNDLVGGSEGIPIEALYPDYDQADTSIAAVIRILKRILDEFDDVRLAFKQHEDVAVADRLLHLQALYEELFCLRNVSDSVGLLASACRTAIATRKSQTITDSQLTALTYASYAIKAAPLMDFDKAMDLVDGIERTGLQTDSEELEILADWLSE